MTINRVLIALSIILAFTLSKPELTNLWYLGWCQVSAAEMQKDIEMYRELCKKYPEDVNHPAYVPPQYVFQYLDTYTGVKYVKDCTNNSAD